MLLVTALLGLALLMMFPIWAVITGALSSQWELEANLAPIFGSSQAQAQWPLLPQAPTLQSLVEVLLDSPGYFTMFWNSVIIALGVLAGQLITAAPAAWALARFPLRGNRLINTLYIVLMLMPFQVLMFPQYLVLRQFQLLDTLGALILPAAFSTFPVFILARCFRAVPKELVEAARLDGAGEVRIFCQIGLPLGAPGILSVAILTFLDAWNMIEQPMTFIKTKALWPLSLFLPEIGLREMGIGFGASLLMLIPALLLFLCCQDYLEQGIALSGGKD